MSVAVSATLTAAASAATPPSLLHCTRPSSVPLTCGNYSSVGLIFLSSSEHAHAGLSQGRKKSSVLQTFLYKLLVAKKLTVFCAFFAAVGSPMQSVEYYLSSSRPNPLCFGCRRLVMKVLLIYYPACFLLDMGTNNASDIIVLLYNSESHRMLI